MKRVATWLGLLLLAAAGSWAQAAEPAAQADYRHYVMEAIGGHMQAMGTILRKRVRPEDLDVHALNMRELAALTPHLFPEGSLTAKSEALPAIWENPRAFNREVERFVEAAQALAEVTSSGDMRKIGRAMQTLGKSCKSCHDDFKAE